MSEVKRPRVLPTPVMRSVPEANKWRLVEQWQFKVKPDKEQSQLAVWFTVEAGYEWDGASKPLHNSAIFVLPSCHWKLVVPSLEHDWLCDHRDHVAALGIDSVHAARHFRRLCERYHVNDDGFMDIQEMYWAVRLGGPKWERTDLT